MSLAPVHVVPVLAVPFGVVAIAGGHELNALLTPLLLDRARTDATRPFDPLCHRSADDLLEWPDEPMRRLGAEMLRGVVSVLAAVNDFTDAHLRSLQVRARAWFTIIGPDGCLPPTNYPLSAWCAVYCLAAPEPAVSRQDSGILRLQESRLGTSFADATTAQMRLPYRPGHYGWRPVPGQLAVFPAWITHEIALLKSAEPLVLVTARLRFQGPGQEGFTRW